MKTTKKFFDVILSGGWYAKFYGERQLTATVTAATIYLEFSERGGLVLAYKAVNLKKGRLYSQVLKEAKAFAAWLETKEIA